MTSQKRVLRFPALLSSRREESHLKLNVQKNNKQKDETLLKAIQQLG